MWRPPRISAVLPSSIANAARPANLRDRLAGLTALVTVVCVVAVFFFSKRTSFLMPGPLSSSHGSIEECSACHTKSGSGKLSWTHGLVAGDPRADSKACITCHKMPETAFNAHGAAAEVLEKSSERLAKVASGLPQPHSARAQSVAFPTHDMVAGGLTCATCHQEHQGVNFKLGKITNAQCRSCHVLKFDSFDGDHPKFENYPFKKRTPIVYDHAAHFDKHFPEVTKKDPAKRIPSTCSTCHNSSDDKRIMAVAPFDKTCSTCHLDQITGKERVSGPKGIAFLALPGVDLQSLKKKNAAIGEWPDASDAPLTPFMKVMISRTEGGRALLKTVDRLNLQDLTVASDDQMLAVTSLLWEIKALFHALISGKASDVLGDLNIGGAAKLSATLVSDLTASIPRDVLISAQQQWLPNLGTEMANRKTSGDQGPDGWKASSRVPSLPGPAASVPIPDEQLGPDTANSSSEVGDRGIEPERAAEETEPPETGQAQSDADAREAPAITKRDPKPCVVRVFGQCLLSKEPGTEAKAAKPDRTADETATANSESDRKEQKTSAGKLPPPMQAGLKDAAPPETPTATPAEAPEPSNEKTDSGKSAPPASSEPQNKTAGKAANQSDDLLFPTEAEQREMKSLTKDSERAAQPDVAGGKPEPAASPNAQPPAAPVISIESDVDPESWADYGGWYRQDFAIFYRPTGHKDKFVYAWLFLTGPKAPKNDATPAAAVFDFLTGKDAQGSCTKCHSIDDLQGGGRAVNFAPPTVASKLGRFTSFIHEPHFGIKEDRGCLTCHAIDKGRPYLKTYEQGNPQIFASNFGAVKKDLCQTCHSSSKARQDCLTCHKYHVNGVMTPIMITKVPTP